MTVRYRYWPGNVALAGALLAIALAFGVSMWHSDGSQGPVLSWWTLPWALLLVGLLVVRCLRWGVTVDDIGLTMREPLTTTYVPWTSVAEIEFSSAFTAAIRLADGRRVRVTVGSSREPSLREVYSRVRERWAGVDVGARPYPRPGWRALSIGFIVSAVVVIGGGLVWEDAQYDGDVYAARDLRDRQATAVVARSWVTKQSGGEGGPTYTTYVKARLRVPDGSTVVLEVHRPGELGGVYHEEDPLPVVYDSAHPRDADFADRPNRDANDDSVAVRSTIGAPLYWAGALGVVAFGIVIAFEWFTPVRLTRRTSRSPR